MAICPHCRENSIGVHAKWWSSAPHPIRCKLCGGLSFIQRYNTTFHDISTGALLIAIVPAIVWSRSLLIAAFIFAVVAAVTVHREILFYRAEMIATDAASVSEARRWERIGVTIMFVIGAVIFTAVYINRAG